MKTKKAVSVQPALFILCLIATLQSCVDHTLPEVIVDECGGQTVSYAIEVDPIVDTNCAVTGCHNGDNGADKNWTIFSNFQSNSADVRDRITRPPGVPGHMPAAGSITEEEIQTIVCWVDQGAKAN